MDWNCLIVFKSYECIAQRRKYAGCTTVNLHDKRRKLHAVIGAGSVVTKSIPSNANHVILAIGSAYAGVGVKAF